jgi:hypothetical protein
MLFRLFACGLDANNTDFLQAQANAASIHSEDAPTCSNSKRTFNYFGFIIGLYECCSWFHVWICLYDY